MNRGVKLVCRIKVNSCAFSRTYPEMGLIALNSFALYITMKPPLDQPTAYEYDGRTNEYSSSKLFCIWVKKPTSSILAVRAYPQQSNALKLA